MSLSLALQDARGSDPLRHCSVRWAPAKAAGPCAPGPHVRPTARARGAVLHRLRLSRPSQEGEALSTPCALRATWSLGRSCAAKPRPCGARLLSLACRAPLL